MTKVAVLDDYQGVAYDFADWSPVLSRANVSVFRDTITDEDQLVERLKPFDVICVMRERTPLPARILSRLPNLKLIVTTSGRNASIDMEAALQNGVTVSGTRNFGNSTGELAFALIMQLARNINFEANALNNGLWQTRIGRHLHGACLGLIGLGRVGSEVAHFAKAFGMDVIAWSENLTPEAAAEKGVRHVSKKELFEQADFASVHVRMSPRTKHLIGAQEFSLMKRDAYFINTSRDGIVNQKALIEALKQGKIAGAALDVYDLEPLPSSHPLREAPNLIMTPHIGYVTKETYQIFYQDTVEAIVAWLDHNPIRVID